MFSFTTWLVLCTPMFLLQKCLHVFGCHDAFLVRSDVVSFGQFWLLGSQGFTHTQHVNSKDLKFF